MQLIDKQQHIAAVRHFLDHFFDAFLKLAAVFGTGNHARHIQCDHAFVLKHRWNGSEHDPLCQPFCDRRLADTRLTDQARIVLRPAA